jgi:GT2 family glycosyltransferase/glycosyltransferase involved in cell wall biosynthesis
MVGTSKLELVLRDVVCSLDEGRESDALRFADRARRLAPEDVTLLVLQASIQLKLGLAADATRLLSVHDHPQLDAIRAEAACMLGDAAAAGTCAALVLRHPIDGLPNLRSLAERVCRSRLDSAGWIGIDRSMRLVGEVRDVSGLCIRVGDAHLAPSFGGWNEQGLTPFSHDMAGISNGPVIATRDGSPLIGSGLAWPPDFGCRGWVAAVGDALVGEADCAWDPDNPVALFATAASGVRTSVPCEGERGLIGWRFSCPLADLGLAGEVAIHAQLPDGSHAELAGSPLTLGDARGHAAVRAANRSNSSGRGARRNARRVDIVIPVYAAATETLECLQAVLATVSRDVAEIVVVDDAGPDPGLRHVLEGLAESGAITLLTNAVNLGFPDAANRGMGLHPDRDVVLLNSDTEPFGDWLARLSNAAYSAADIATVTPLGSEASIASYPADGHAVSRVAAKQYDDIAARVNAGLVIDVPVGVGFCLYIKRKCLDDVGLFDARSFGRGYGEENDLCLRAAAVGWRHVAAPDVYVRHGGGRSFGAEKQLLMARNQHLLNQRYPHYAELVGRFHALDPLSAARRAVDCGRLAGCASGGVLLLTLALPGGVQRHVDLRRRALSAAGRTVYELRPLNMEGPEGAVRLVDPGAELKNLVYRLPRDLAELRHQLNVLGIVAVEVHHFLGIGADALALATGLGVAYEVFIHDYSWICPRLNLMGTDDVYCGEPAVEHCVACVATNGSAMDAGLSVVDLRARSADILARAARVVAPSHDTRARLSRYFPDVCIDVTPWEPAVVTRPRYRATSDGRTRVAVIGAIGLHKGYRVLLECARDAAARALPLDFIVVGHTHDDIPLLEIGNVFITGPYADDEIDELLDRERCRLAWFASVAPETWCYALTHAFAAGLHVVAFDLGAIGERARQRADATLLPLGVPAWRINQALMKCAPAANAPAVRPVVAAVRPSLELMNQNG